MTTTAQPTFRKTKTGQWVAFGPVTNLRVGQVAVSKRDGSTKTVVVEKLGRAFTVDGVQCAYGYIAETTTAAAARPARRRYFPRYELCRHCGGDGAVEQELGECAKCGRDFDC